MAEYGGRVYLRKNAADGPLDMYTEQKEAAKQMSKRLSFYYVTAISQFMLGVIMLGQILYDVKLESAPFYINLVFGIGLMISGIVFFILGIRKHRKYAISKEDNGIWE